MRRPPPREYDLIECNNIMINVLYYYKLCSAKSHDDLDKCPIINGKRVLRSCDSTPNNTGNIPNIRVINIE